MQHLGAAVSVLETSSNVKGVVRMTQVDEENCVIEGTIDGLRPGAHGLNVHEYGDISEGCSRSVQKQLFLKVIKLQGI